MKDYKGYKSHMKQKRFNKFMDIAMGVVTVILGFVTATWWLILLTGGL